MGLRATSEFSAVAAYESTYSDVLIFINCPVVEKHNSSIILITNNIIVPFIISSFITNVTNLVGT